MPTRSDRYNAVLIRARKRLGKVHAASDKAIAEAFVRMILAIEKELEKFADGSPSKIRRARLLKSLFDELREYNRSVRAAVFKGVSDASRLGGAQHIVASRAAGASATLLADLKGAFDKVPVRAIDGMLRRRGLAKGIGLKGYTGLFKTLMDRKLGDQAKVLDDLLENIIATGKGRTKATKDVAKFLASREPKVLEALKSLGARGGRTKAAIARGDKIPVAILDRAVRTLRQAELISVHEINSAYDEANKMAMHRSTMVGACRWRVSGRHEGLRTSPDVCDIAATEDLFGLGPGVYETAYCPSLMHPRCACTVEAILRPVADWNKPKPKPRLPKELDENRALSLMQSAKVTAKKRRNLTRKYVKRQTRTINAKLKSAVQESERFAGQAKKVTR